MNPNARAKESLTSSNPRFCPYCGYSKVSYLEGTCLCLSCGASFTATKIDHLKYHTIQARAEYEPLHMTTTIRSSSRLQITEPPKIDKALKALRLPKNVREVALTVYKRALALEVAHGRGPSIGLASASVYAACKQNRFKKSLPEIAQAFGVNQNETESYYTYLIGELGYLGPEYSSRAKPVFEEPNVDRFLEKKGTYEFLRLLKEKPRRWKTMEKELELSPRTLSERISQALELGLVEKVRRLKIGATYYRLTKKGTDIFEEMTGNTQIY